MRTFATADGREIVLLHTRLKIIDLDDRAAQPFVQGTRTWVYNGELYNYRELGAQFEGLRTSSDTEVLARIVEADGWAGLDRCEGMWAFAAYDQRSGEFVLCRDRFGEKPLLLHRDTDGGLWFASEVGALEALIGRRFPVDAGCVRRYLGFGYRAIHHGSPTFLRGVEALAPGSILTIDGSGVERSDRYWSPASPAEEADWSFEETVEIVRAQLIESVAKRLRADVPLAFCMSGGVDSASLISIAKRELGFDVHGFTIDQSDPRYDESAVIDQAVGDLGIHHTYVRPESVDFLDRLQTIVNRHGQPVATISYYVHDALMEAIAGQGYRVSISGTGADELFTGYLEHFPLYVLDTADEDAAADWLETIVPGTRNPLLRDLRAFAADLDSRVRHSHLDDPNWVAFAGDLTISRESLAASAEGLLRRHMLDELFVEVVPVILNEDDLNAMSWSIENRSPYLDRALFDITRCIPTSQLIRNGRAKAVLREAAKGLVPDVVLDCPKKVGFNAAIEGLVDFEDADVRNRVLADGAIWEYVDRVAFADLVARPALTNNEGKFVFAVLSTAAFLKGRLP